MTSTAPDILRDIRAYYQSPGPAVTIPLIQSFASGLSLGLTAAALSWGISFGDPLKIGVIVAAFSQTVAWYQAIRRWQDLIWSLESSLDTDIDHDGQIGQPEPPRQTIRVQLEQGNHTQFIDLPATLPQLRSLAASGDRPNESALTGSGRPFSVAGFRALRDELIRRGLATWLNDDHHAQGWQINAAGRAVLRRLAAPSPTAPEDHANSSTPGVRVRAYAQDFE